MRLLGRLTAFVIAVGLLSAGPLSPGAGAREPGKRATPLKVGDADVTRSGALEVDESTVRVEWLGDDEVVAVLPVENHSATTVKVVASAHWEANRWNAGEPRTVSTSLAPGVTEIRVRLRDADAWLRATATRAVLAWSVSVRGSDARVSGRRSLAEALEQLRVTVSVPARPKRGEAVPFRATVTREPGGEVAAGASVRIVESTSWSSLAAPATERGLPLFEGVTDAFGAIDGELVLPDQDWGLAIGFQATLGTAAGGVVVGIQPAAEAEDAPTGRMLLSTDKPIYQPGQEIHVRVLALRSGDLLPAAGTALTFSIRDPRGTRILQEERVVDAFGVAHISLPLADELLLGDYRIDVTGEDLAAAGTVEVKEYDLPRFSPVVTMDEPYAVPGGEITGEVAVDYVFGEPVRRALVDVDLLRQEDASEPHDSDRVRTRNDGNARFRVRVPEHFGRSEFEDGTAAVHLRVTAEDEAGQRQTTTVRVAVATGDLRVRLIADAGRLETGAPNVFHLSTVDASGRPVEAECIVRLAGAAIGSARTDERGYARLVTSPLPAGRKLDVTATAARSGASATQTFSFDADTVPGYLLAQPLSAMVASGAELAVDLLSSEEGGAVHVDLVVQQRVVESATATIENGVARVTFTPTADVIGDVCIEARILAAEGRLLADRRRVVVDLGGDLRVDLTPDRAEYRAGDDATLDIEVRLPDGVGVQAELGVTAVDEAVYLLTAGRAGVQGLELSGAALDGSETLGGGVTLGDLLAGERVAQDQELAAGILAAQPAEDFVDSRTYRRALEREEQASSVAVDAESIAEFFRDKGKRARRRHMARGEFADPWGTPYRLDIRGHPRQLHLVSAGPDEQFGTQDDLELATRVRPQEFTGPIIGFFGGGTGAAFGDFGGARTDTGVAVPGAGVGTEFDDSGSAAASAAPRVRSFFPETLLVLPDLVTDANGDATLPLRLADSLTTWRVAALASTADGRLGSGSAALQVKQELAVDLKLPRRLTQGDRLELPAIAYNLTGEPREVTASLTSGDWFEVHGATQHTLVVEPHSAARVTFEVLVLAHGEHALRVDLTDGEFADAVQMTTVVAPDARPVAFTRSGRVDGSATEVIEIPALAQADSIDMRVRILPGVVSQTLDGLDALLQEPHGCFEQTSSSTYPNALILRYLRESGSVDPGTEKVARGFLAKGLQRLLSFEVGNGSFSYWGTPPANLPLTAYALREFSDIAQVRDVDPDLIDRVASWLVSRQHADGAWRPSDGAAAQRYETDPLRVTAYVAWSLVDAGRSGDNVQRALGFVRANAPAETDLYTRVVCANALLAADRSDSAGAALLQGILAERTQDEQGTRWSYDQYGDSGRRGITSSSGPAADNELTAMMVPALMADGGHSQVVSDVLDYLAGARQQWGGWGSTHATIWVIKAFVESLPAASLAASAQVTVAVNGEVAEILAFDGRDVVREVDVSHLARPGSNVVEVTTDQGRPYYTVAGRYFAPWTEPAPEPESLAVDVRLETKSRKKRAKRKKLRSGRRTVMKVRIKNVRGTGAAEMVTAVVGLAPGCDVDEHALRDLRDDGRIERYELTGTGVNLYLPRLEEGEVVEVPVSIVPTLQGEVRVPHTIAYEFYDPSSRGTAAPQLVEIR